MAKIVKVGNVKIGRKLPFTLIAGPCVIENKRMAFDIARKLKKLLLN